MNLRHLLATSAASALLCPLAHAAGDTAPAEASPPAAGTELPTIAVTDTRRLPESFDQRYATTQVLTRADLERLSPSEPSITQALATLPGVTVSSNGGPGSSASVSIRGSSASQVAVFIDGIPIGSPTTGIAPWADLPTEAFERVEVISGPAAASFGANAMGGVVQCLRAAPRSAEPDERVVRRRLEQDLRYAAAHVRHRAVHRPARRARRLTYSLGLHDYNTAGIDATQPVLPYHEAGRNPYHAQDLDARLGYARDNWSVSTFALYHRSDLSYDNAGFANRQLDHQLTTGVAFHLDITRDTQFASRSVMRATGSSCMRTIRPSRPTRSIRSASACRRRSRIRSTASGCSGCRCRARRSWPTTSRASRRSCLPTCRTAYRRATTRRFAASVGDARQRDDVRRGPARDHHGQAVNTGNVALSWAITPVYAARVSYGNAFRLPSFNDLYYPGYGNPNLNPERSDSVEAALDANTAYGTFSAAIYDTRVNNLIAYNPATFSPMNIGRAHIRGIDLSYKGTIGRSTPVSIAVGILNPQDVTNESWLSRRPRQTFSASVDHTWDELRLHALSTGATLSYGGTTFDDPANTTYLPSYLSVNLRASYKVNAHLTVSATLSNLFDRQYMTAYGYNTLGRTASGKISYTF
jgi:vitamin B12 transporter